VTLPDAKDRLGEDSSRPLVYNNETERVILEQAETQKKILALLEDRLPRAANPNSPEPPKKKGGRPPLEWETMFMWTTKVLLQHGIPRKADELIERMREACRTAGIEVPAVSTLEPTAFKWMQILRDELK
jgi:hypothetical protein